MVKITGQRHQSRNADFQPGNLSLSTFSASEFFDIFCQIDEIETKSKPLKIAKSINMNEYESIVSSGTHQPSSPASGYQAKFVSIHLFLTILPSIKET